MRFYSLAALSLSCAVTTASAGSSAAVSYNEGQAARSGRELRLLGTDPDIDIYYDGTSASCPTPPAGSGRVGRRFDAKPSESDECTDPENSWEMTFVLDVGTVSILSCPIDGVLIISTDKTDALPDTSVPTTGDCNFLSNTQKDLLDQPQYKDKLSIVSMGAKAMELLCDWPVSLPLTYTLNKRAEFAIQRGVLSKDTEDPNALYDKPAEQFVYSDSYQSLCFAAGQDSYVQDANGFFWAKLDLEPPCAGETDMLVGAVPELTQADCTSVPKNAINVGIDYVSGNCMGRCGKGCGEHPNSPAQFTNDCLDYDACVRFRSDTANRRNCNDEFLKTIDDTIWSGDCDFATKKEVAPDPCGTSPAPETTTAAPVAAPIAKPIIVIRPVVVTGIQNGDCNGACRVVSGSWVCTEAGLEEQAFRFYPEFIVHEALKIGLPCDTVVTGEDATASAMARIVVDVDNPTPPGSASPYPIICYPHKVNQTESFDCGASVGPNEIRLCTCYERP